MTLMQENCDVVRAFGLGVYLVVSLLFVSLDTFALQREKSWAPQIIVYNSMMKFDECSCVPICEEAKNTLYYLPKKYFSLRNIIIIYKITAFNKISPP